MLLQKKCKRQQTGTLISLRNKNSIREFSLVKNNKTFKGKFAFVSNIHTKMVMNIELDFKNLRNPVIIEGFPGFGFVSTIVTQYLIKHLNAKPIGRITSNKLAPIAAIHNKDIIYPLEIFYDKKTNILILQALTSVEGVEWEIADTLIEIANKVKAKEIISLEGVASDSGNLGILFYTNQSKDKPEAMNLKPLKEGVVVGVSGALLMKSKEFKIPFYSFFAETQTKLPDNKAAAEIIKVLDKHLNLTVDYKPLIDKAKELETQLKTLLSQITQAKSHKEKKILSYTG